jgi:hypothetical protein
LRTFICSRKIQLCRPCTIFIPSKDAKFCIWSKGTNKRVLPVRNGTSLPNQPLSHQISLFLRTIWHVLQALLMAARRNVVWTLMWFGDETHT